MQPLDKPTPTETPDPAPDPTPTTDESTDTSSVSELSREPSTEGLQSQAAPVSPASQAPSSVFQPVSSKDNKKKKLIIIIAAVLVLLGGGAAAYKFWYQNPNKVLGDGLTHYLTSKGPETNTGTVDVSNDQASVGMAITARGLAGESSGEATLKITLNEGELKGKTFSIKGSGIYKQDGTVYFKVSDVKNVVSDLVDVYVDNLAAQYKSYGYTITDAQKKDAGDAMHKQIDPIVAKFDDKWVKMTADDLKGTDDKAAKQYQCFTDSMKKLSDDASLKELGEVYKKNQFITIAKELGSKDGSLGYEVSLDKAKAKEFGKQVEGTAVGKALKACEDDSSTTKTSTDEDVDSLETKTFQVWVDRWSHKFTRIVYEGTSTDKTDKTKTDIKLNMNLDYAKSVTITAPSDATSLKDLIKSFESIGVGPKSSAT